MKYAELMDAKDRADLKKAESRIEEGRAIKRRVQGRLRARAYRLNAKNKSSHGKPTANRPVTP